MSVKTKAVLIICSALIVVAGFLYLWFSGRIWIRADVTNNCQGTSKVSSFLGKPGSNLVTYNFFGISLSVHALVVPYLDNIQAEFAKQKISYTFNDIDSYNNRSKRGGGGTSMHAWGSAFDINPQSNPYWGSRKGEMRRDIPDSVVNIFKQNGFFWGGDWPGNRDPMHFEWYPAKVSGQILDAQLNQPVLLAATFYDSIPITNAGGRFDWVLPYGRHTILSEADDYADQQQDVELTCFSLTNVNFMMAAESERPVGPIGNVSGHINNYSQYQLFRPGGNIYLDGRLITNIDRNGNYKIKDVPVGTHKVDIRFYFVKAGETSFELKAGESLTGIDIIVGQ